MTAKQSQETKFVELLTKKAKEQAAIEATSPIPEWLRPTIALIGRYTWQSLLGGSFLLAVGISTLSYAAFLRLYTQGTIGWLIEIIRK